MVNNKKTEKPQIPSIRKLLQNLVEILKKHVEAQVPKKKKKKIEMIAEWVKGVRMILTNVIIIILIFFFIVLICLELRKDVVIIEPIEVPEEIMKQGYTGKVITNKLIDKINFIQKRAKMSMERIDFRPTWLEPQIELEFIGSGISFNSIILYLKKLFCIEPIRIGGEVAIQNQQMYTTIRIRGMTEKTILGDLKEPKKILSEAAKRLCKHLKPHILAYYLYFEEEEKDESIETIQYVLSHEPTDDDCWAYNLWGLILLKEEKLECASDKFKKAIKCNPKFPFAYNCLGSVLKEQKHFKGAKKMYKMAVKLDPEFSWAYINWGNVFSAEKKYEEAKKKYRMAVKINPKSSFAYANWGSTLFKQGKYKEAIDKFEKATQIDPKLSWPYINWGLALHNQKDYKGAVDKYEKAHQLAPEDPLPYNFWGDTLREQENYEGAMEKYKKAIEFDSKYPHAYYALGLALKNKNDYRSAIENFHKAFQLGSNKMIGKLASNEIKLIFQSIVIEILNIFKKNRSTWLLSKFLTVPVLPPVAEGKVTG